MIQGQKPNYNSDVLTLHAEAEKLSSHKRLQATCTATHLYIQNFITNKHLTTSLIGSHFVNCYNL